ncbi:hypothetical protein [uncultured Paraglaciecola sp.]|uniref:hypothetical protein n=1 Tax=uncultured Paraglaciecola sp. TaxID=1765024 RepID=UPI0025F878F8|nr:hypothetical protein [uncultured Paraglaciecola sp.]
MKKSLKIIGVILGTLALLLVLSFSAFYYWFTIGAIDFEPQKFDSTIWKNTEPTMSWESVRLKMVDDLIENEIINGMNKSSVIALLGEPDDTPYFQSYDMVYYLGRERQAIAIDSEWLVFKIVGNKVDSYALVRD